MTNIVYKGDIPADLDLGSVVALDTETMGLDLKRDRLCVVQLSSGDGNAHLVQFAPDQYEAPNLRKMLSNKNTQFLYHFGRFDIAQLVIHFDILTENVYCTRTASKLVRTYTDNHGLKALCEELLGMDISKKQQTSYWGADELNEKQIDYAANDVLHLHKLKDILDERLQKENRADLAKQVMSLIPARALLDVEGWPDDIFAH